MIIKNGTLITASETYRTDILIEGEQIKAIYAYRQREWHADDAPC